MAFRKHMRPRATGRLVMALLVWSALAVWQGAHVDADEAGARSEDRLFYFEPKTPERMIRAAILANRLDRPDLARRYLRNLIDSQPDAALLRKLRSEYGIGTFLKLGAVEALQPESAEVLRLINEAFRQDPLDAGAVDALISDLGTSPEATAAAVRRIVAAGDVAVVPLLNADTDTPSGQLAERLLTQHARRFRRGLVQALRTAPVEQQPRILKLIGRTAAPFFLPDLLRFRVSESADVASAANQATAALLGRTPEDVTVAVVRERLLSHVHRLIRQANAAFVTDELRREEVGIAREFAPDADLAVYGHLTLRRALTLAQDAAAVAPEDEAAVATLLTCELAEQMWPAHWPTGVTVPAGLKAADVDPVSRKAISIAIDTDNTAALIQLLSDSNRSLAVIQQSPELLRRCRLYPDVRVRLLTAALETASGLTSMYTRQTIQSVLYGSAHKEAVAIDSRVGEAANSAAALESVKYSAVAANTGQLGFDRAVAQLQCDLILVHSNCLRWNLPDTVSNLRADYRLKKTPIVIYGPERDRPRTKHLLSAWRGVWFITGPISEYTLADTLRLMDVTPPRLTETERHDMIRLARQLKQ